MYIIQVFFYVYDLECKYVIYLHLCNPHSQESQIVKKSPSFSKYASPINGFGDMSNLHLNEEDIEKLRKASLLLEKDLGIQR